MTNSEDRVGRRPTPEELRLIQLAAALSPVESLRRIETRSSFVLTNIGLLGTVVALSATLGVRHGHGPGLMSTIAVISGFGAAFCSLLANAPSLRLGINPSNLKEVKDYFESQVKLRGWLTRISYLLLLLTFISGAVVLLSGT